MCRAKQPSFQWDASGMEGFLFVAKVIIMELSDCNFSGEFQDSLCPYINIFDYMHTCEDDGEAQRKD